MPSADPGGEPRLRLVEAPGAPSRSGQRRESDPDPGLVTRSESMRDVYALVRRAARARASVLVAGESGTGKERVARVLHAFSDRASCPFVAVNCTAIPEGLLESELFGYVRGAFTGAHRDRRGLFQQAHGGTLFLDEIGDLSPDLQAKLLRAIQEGEVRPVGGSAPVPVDVRIVAATRRDLEVEMELGRFREDLYYRLNAMHVKLPPLRERPEDIPALIEVFARRQRPERPRHFTLAAIRVLQARPWPGNVRELENLVDRILVLSDADPIDVTDLRHDELRRDTGSDGFLEVLDRGLDEAPRRGVSLHDLEERYIDRALALSQGHQKRAARLLEIDRKTLYRRLLRRKPPQEG